MTSKVLKITLVFLLISTSIGLTFAWGRWGHKHISRAAVFALPAPMQKFYYNHIDFITEGAVVPDLRRSLVNDKNEPPRHYIDVENFNMPVSSLPKTSKEAFEKYDSSFFNRNGFLPWYIEELTDKLTYALRKETSQKYFFFQQNYLIMSPMRTCPCTLLPITMGS